MGIEAEARCDVEKDDGKRDRQPFPAIDHFVEIGVADVVVVVVISAIAVDVEHLRVQVAQPEDRRIARVPSCGGAAGQVVETGQVAVDVELRILLQVDYNPGAVEGGTGQLSRPQLDELPPSAGVAVSNLPSHTPTRTRYA